MPSLRCSAAAGVNKLFRTVMAKLRLVFQVKSSSADLHDPYLRRNRAITQSLRRGRTDDAEQALLSYLSDADWELLEASEAGSIPS